MADITKIELPDGSKYDIKDSVSGYITAKTTLAGYGITDAKIENGSITLGSNSITPLTSFTETDPVFSASAAYGISSTDITNWDKIYGLFTVTSGNSDGDYWWVLKIPQTGLYRYTNAPGSSGGLKEIYLPHSGSSRNTIIVNAAYTSSSNTLTLPNKTGTFALTSDIPTVPTNISAFTNDAGYLTSETYTGTVTSVQVAATSPVQSSTSTASSTTLSTIISLADTYGDTKNPYGTKTANYVLAGPTTGSATAPSFRALVAADIPDLSGTYATKATTLSGYGITDAYISNGTITLGSDSITPLTSAPVTSVNGQTGAVSLTIPTVPTNISAFTNDSGYITSYTETDPIFTASAAYGISSSDIANWNKGYLPLSAGSDNPLTDKLWLENEYGRANLGIGSAGGITLSGRDENGNATVGMHSYITGSSGRAILYAWQGDGGAGRIMLRPRGQQEETGQVIIDSNGQQIGGHPITRATALSSNKSITASTVTVLQGLTGLDAAGVYLFTAHVTFTPSAATAGYWYVGFHNGNNTTAPGSRTSQWTANTNRKDVIVSFVGSGSTTMYSKMYSTVAGSVTASTTTFTAVRLS